MRIGVLGVVAALGAVAAGAAEPRWREADVWRQPSGLPQDSVITILQTRDGYIWAGTRAGVTRFDGVRFTTFDDRDKTQLRENEVWALVEGNDGSLWIGVYGGGLSRLEDGHFKVYGTADGLVDDFVRLVVKDSAGALWIGTDSGVSRFASGSFTNITTKDGLHPGGVRALHPEPDGSVLVAMQGGIQRIKDGRVLGFELPDAAVGLVNAFCRDRSGALWIGTADGLLRVAGGTTTRYATAHGLSSNDVRRLHEDVAGRLWVATTAGLDRHRGLDAGAPLFANEAVSNDLTALFGDREGSLWVGHRGAGLSRFHQGIFSSYAASDGLPDSETTTVVHGRRASWVGTSRGLSLLHAGRFTTLGEAHGLPPGASINALAEDSAGQLWVGTAKGVYKSEPWPCGEPRCAPRFRALREHPILASSARVFLEDRQGAVWVGTDRSGLAKVEPGRVTTFTTANGLSHDAIRALAEARDGSLWIGTKGGLVRLRDGAFTTFREADGLPNRSIQTLYRDSDDTLWIATRQGVSRFKDGRFTTYAVKDGLYWSHVYSFQEDDLGLLWMGSGKGVFRIAKRQLNDFAAGRIRSISSVAYGREHGLPSTMAAVATNPGSAKSADGRVWFAIVGGLAVADPRRLPINEAVPPVHIEEARIDGRALDLKAPLPAPPGGGDFTFRYTALSYEAPQAVKFKYRLLGHDADWVEADTRRVAYYTNMPPGDYRFRVIACNSDGVWNEVGAEIAFAMAPHFYQTRWFYTALALALILVGAGTQGLRMRSLRQRERDLRARVDAALAEVKVLSGLLPICASCKKIRDDSGSWNQMETYIHTHSEAEFSHGICPECSEKLYPGVAQRIRDKKAAAP